MSAFQQLKPKFTIKLYVQLVCREEGGGSEEDKKGEGLQQKKHFVEN